MAKVSGTPLGGREVWLMAKVSRTPLGGREVRPNGQSQWRGFGGLPPKAGEQPDRGTWALPLHHVPAQGSGSGKEVCHEVGGESTHNTPTAAGTLASLSLGYFIP